MTEMIKVIKELLYMDQTLVNEFDTNNRVYKIVVILSFIL